MMSVIYSQMGQSKQKQNPKHTRAHTNLKTWTNMAKSMDSESGYTVPVLYLFCVSGNFQCRQLGKMRNGQKDREGSGNLARTESREGVQPAGSTRGDSPTSPEGLCSVGVSSF